MRINNIFDQIKRLKQMKLSDVRSVISSSCYKIKPSKAVFWYLFDLAFFITGVLMVFSSHSVLMRLAGGLVMGVAAAMMFVWAHDAAHGTLFKSKRVAEIMGTVFMLPALSVFRLWIYGHNKVHHGFTSFSPIDWIWRPLSPKQYNELSLLQKLLYRITNTSRRVT